MKRGLLTFRWTLIVTLTDVGFSGFSESKTTAVSWDNTSKNQSRLSGSAKQWRLRQWKHNIFPLCQPSFFCHYIIVAENAKQYAPYMVLSLSVSVSPCSWLYPCNLPCPCPFPLSFTVSSFSFNVSNFAFIDNNISLCLSLTWEVQTMITELLLKYRIWAILKRRYIKI